MRKSLRCLAARGVAAIALLFTAASASALTLESQIGELAGKVGQSLKQAGYGSCKVDIKQTYGAGLPELPGSGPVFIKEVIGRELQTLGITVKKFRADVGVACEVKVTEVKGSTGKISAIAMMVVLNFVDASDNPILSLDSQKMSILEPGDVAKFLGIPFENPQPDMPVKPGVPGGGGSPEPIITGYIKPEQHVSRGSVIRAQQDGQFAIEVLVGGRGKPAQTEDGIAYVELLQNDECEIRLINDSEYEVGVELVIDGLDCFWFSQQRKGLWIVGPRSQTVVKGWQLDAAAARRFQIVPFAQSVAAQAGNVGEIGVICAHFYRSYPEGQPLPSYEQESRRKGLGVGAGEQFENRVKLVKRQMGLLRASIPVRYEKPTFN